MASKESRQVAKIKSYKICFGSPHGKTVLYDLMRSFHVFGSCETDEQEGERRVILRIMALLQMDPIQMEQLINEQKEEEKRYE